MNYYTFLIDTSAYSGNFEREMTAFMTGKTGDCEVGALYAKMFESEDFDFDFSNSIYNKMDDEYGIRRPCEIAITPGYVNNGMGTHAREDSTKAKSFKDHCPSYQSVAIYFREDPSEHITFLRDRAYKFAEYYNVHGRAGQEPSEQITIEHFRLTENNTTSRNISI